MQKHSTKRSTRNNIDLYGDILKIREAFSDTAKDAKGKAAEVWSQSVDNVKEKTTDIQSVMSDYVSERPMKSLSLALISGYLLGAFMMRKKVKYRRNI